MEKDHIVIRIDPVLDKDTLKFSELFSDFRIIALETKPECLLNMFPADLKFSNDTFYLFDRRAKTVFLFSGEGKYLSKISKEGKGPGEYVSPADFQVDAVNGEVLIFDWASQKLLRYTREGEYSIIV